MKTWLKPICNSYQPLNETMTKTVTLVESEFI